MQTHKFAKGDKVIVQQDPSRPSVRGGLYTVVQPLPIAGSGVQYRVRSASDPHERVIDEAWMRAADRW